MAKLTKLQNYETTKLHTTQLQTTTLQDYKAAKLQVSTSVKPLAALTAFRLPSETSSLGPGLLYLLLIRCSVSPEARSGHGDRPVPGEAPQGHEGLLPRPEGAGMGGSWECVPATNPMPAS